MVEYIACNIFLVVFLTDLMTLQCLFLVFIGDTSRAYTWYDSIFSWSLLCIYGITILYIL